MDRVYQTTWQLHRMPLLDLSAPPGVCPIALRGLAPNADGLYAADDVMERLDRAIGGYDAIRQEYSICPAA